MKEESHNKNLYWICQITGWSALYIVYCSIPIIFSDFSWGILIGYFNTMMVGFFLTHQFRNIIKNKQWPTLEMQELVLRVILASFIIGAVWAAIVLPVNELIFSYFTEDSSRADRRMTFGLAVFIAFNLGIIVLIWSLIYFIYHYFTNYKQAEIDKWKLEAAVKDAQLLALKSQINPHFMFNCLNNIRSLVVENPEKARDMILHLSDLLRYSLQFSNKEKISLEDELEIVKNYLILESIQYEDRLRYKLNIHDDTLELKIPPMAIQLLVENAIKHGISLLPGGGEIEIITRLEKNSLIVEVVNTGQLVKKREETTGIGLQNAAERLKLLFGQFALLSVDNREGNKVAAKFTVPLIY